MPLFPNESFYLESVDSGLETGMTLEQIMAALSTALGQANDDRLQIRIWVYENGNPSP